MYLLRSVARLAPRLVLHWKAIAARDGAGQIAKIMLSGRALPAEHISDLIALTPPGDDDDAYYYRCNYYYRYDYC